MQQHTFTAIDRTCVGELNATFQRAQIELQLALRLIVRQNELGGEWRLSDDASGLIQTSQPSKESA